MANRPIFVPKLDSVGVKQQLLEFKWHAGLSRSQKQKSIRELHGAAKLAGIAPVLEISSKSEIELGVKLSAFNLCLTPDSGNAVFSVETVFQSSKVFERGGPYRDLLGLDSRAAKSDIRLKESGNLTGFDLDGKRFPLVPRTHFYDWLYLNALNQNEDLARQLPDFRGFTDIEFNPARSVNCQAYSAALYVSLHANNRLPDALASPESFLELITAAA